MLECVAVGRKLCWSAQWKVNVVVKMDCETYQIRIFYLWNRSGSFDWVSAHFLSFPFSSFLLVNPSFTRLNSIVSIHEANSKWYRNCIICRASSPIFETFSSQNIPFGCCSDQNTQIRNSLSDSARLEQFVSVSKVFVKWFSKVLPISRDRLK